MQDIELYVFDWDGTVFDSAGAISGAIRAAARDFDFADPGEALARSVIGLGLMDCLHRAVPECREDQIQEFCLCYRDHYLAGEKQTALYPDMERFLRAMHREGLRLAVATGKSRKGLKRVMDRFDLNGIFEAQRTADVTFSKPNPAMLIELSDECYVERSRMVMIGDSIHDIQMARNAGVRSVGMTYGAVPAAELSAAGADILCGSVRELAAALGLGHLLEG